MEPLELRCRFDFTFDLAEVAMINGDSLDNCEDEDERQELLDSFKYLLNMSHFVKEVEIKNVFDEQSSYIDFVMKGTPETNGDGYFYEEYFEDEFGNKGSCYSAHNCSWNEDGSYQMEEPMNLPCHTRTLENGIVIYDWRHQEDYIPAHWEDDKLIGAHHK
jgi:hypothetical protein